MACSVGGMSFLKVGAFDAGPCLEIPSIGRVLDSYSRVPRREITISFGIIGEGVLTSDSPSGNEPSRNPDAARVAVGDLMSGSRDSVPLKNS